MTRWPIARLKALVVAAAILTPERMAVGDSALQATVVPPPAVDVPACEQWGRGRLGWGQNGIRLGLLWSDMRKPADVGMPVTRPYDRLTIYQQTLQQSRSPAIETVECRLGDGIERIVVGLRDTKIVTKTSAVASWKSSTMAELASASSRRVVQYESALILSMWAVLERMPVPGSSATDYLIESRGCIVTTGTSPPSCLYDSRDVVHIRSLVQDLPMER